MRRATRRGGRAVLVCLAVISLGGAAYAQGDAPPSKQYLAAYSDAQTAYNAAIMQGDFSRAKKLFEKAIAFDDRFPGPYRYLALIASNEKKWEECLAQAFIALKKSPNSDNAPKVRELHGQCRSELQRTPFREDFGDGGAIAVTTNVTGAKVRLNGLTYGATPFIRGFAAGPVEVEVSLIDYLPVTVDTEILAGVVTDVVVEMKKDPSVVVPKVPDKRVQPVVDKGWVELAVRPAGATVTVDGKPPVRDDQGRLEAKAGTYTVEVTAPEHEPWRRRVKVSNGQSRTIDVVLRPSAERDSLRTRGYVSLGVAAGLAGVGTFFGILEMRKFEAAQDIWDTEVARPTGIDTSGIEPVHTRDDIDKLRDKGKRYQIISGASFGLAAVALGVSIYYFNKERPVERSGYELPLAIAPTTSPDGGIGAQVTYTTELSW